MGLCASPNDESFAAFLQDPLFLRRILPISHQCLSILTQIFTLDPEHCITLDRLRELILNIDFFTDDAHVPASRREAAHHNVPVHVSAQYTDEVYDSPSLNAEPVFSFDDPKLSKTLHPRSSAPTRAPHPLSARARVSAMALPPPPHVAAAPVLPRAFLGTRAFLHLCSRSSASERANPSAPFRSPRPPCSFNVCDGNLPFLVILSHYPPPPDFWHHHYINHHHTK